MATLLLTGVGRYPQPVSAYDTDAQIYFNGITANGSGISDTSKTAVSNMFAGLKTDGIFSKLIFIAPLAGNNLTAAVVAYRPIAGSSVVMTNNNFVSADFTETGSSGGILGDGTTKYLDTLVDVPSISQNSVSWGYYISTAATVSGINMAMGSSYTATGGTDRLYASDNNGFSQRAMGGEIHGAFFGGLSTIKWDGTDYKTYNNGSVNATSTPPGGVTWQLPGTFLLHKAAGPFYGSTRLTLGFVGNALTDTEAANLYTRVQTFQTALTRNL